MPVEVEIQADGGVVIVGSGVLTGVEIHASNARIYATREQILAQRYQITDLRAVERLDVEVEDVRRIAAQDRAAAAINPRILSVVIGSQDIAYGLARMWAAYVEPAPFETAVFRTMEEARTWLEERVGSAHAGDVNA